MSDTQAVQAGVLVGTSPKPSVNQAGNLARVARETGVSPFRQAIELLRLRGRERGLSPQDYYDHQVYRPELSMAEKREFVGTMGNFRLNLRVSPPSLTHLRGLLRDKITYTALMRQLGFATTETQAAVSRHRRFGNIPTLTDESEIAAFLRDTARYPLFAKPVNGSRAVGTALFTGIDRERGVLKLAKGGEVTLDELVQTILADYPDGYMFQSKVEQHPMIERFAGHAVSTVRLVTIIDDEMPRPLYAIWKIPSPTAMSDNFWQSGSMLCALDLETGTAQSCRVGKGPDTRMIEAHPVSGEKIVGTTLPYWRTTMDFACAMHAVYPDNGLLGWDIAMGPEGPVLIECNANPGHEFYQLSTGRGALNPEMKAVFDKAAARSARIMAERKAKNRAAKT